MQKLMDGCFACSWPGLDRAAVARCADKEGATQPAYCRLAGVSGEWQGQCRSGRLLGGEWPGRYCCNSAPRPGLSEFLCKRGLGYACGRRSSN